MVGCLPCPLQDTMFSVRTGPRWWDRLQRESVRKTSRLRNSVQVSEIIGESRPHPNSPTRSVFEFASYFKTSNLYRFKHILQKQFYYSKHFSQFLVHEFKFNKEQQNFNYLLRFEIWHLIVSQWQKMFSPMEGRYFRTRLHYAAVHNVSCGPHSSSINQPCCTQQQYSQPP